MKHKKETNCAACGAPLKKKSVLREAVNLLAAPSRIVCSYIAVVFPHDRRTGHVLVGASFMLIGSTISATVAHSCSGPYCIVIDATAWALHGIGLAPIIKALEERKLL